MDQSQSVSSNQVALGVCHTRPDSSFVFSIDPSGNRFVINHELVPYIVDHSNKLWYMTKPLAMVMEYGGLRQLFSGISKQNKKSYLELQQDCKSRPVDPIQPNAVFIDQKGLDSLLNTSEKPIAKQFKQWLTTHQGMILESQALHAANQEITRLKQLLYQCQPHIAAWLNEPGERHQLKIMVMNDSDFQYDFCTIRRQERTVNSRVNELQGLHPHAEVILTLGYVVNAIHFWNKIKKMLPVTCHGVYFNTTLSVQDLISNIQELLHEFSSLNPMIEPAMTAALVDH